MALPRCLMARELNHKNHMVVGEWFSFGWKDRPVGLGQGSILSRRSFALSLLWPPGNLHADLLRRPRPPVYQGAFKWT
ncbi:predicted protein [Arabidopsis lyrata subsp. lyrata]|uniref:Predicted protein n=1 Tax=Arabidopsis lyrata subsp. lyrata TaxID=81972 RepID=D7L1Z4_ARALL|nr:predicted protein [Arabidopsis lyrata subsp. lyrata]